MRAKRIAILLACVYTLNSALPVMAAEAGEPETVVQTEAAQETGVAEEAEAAEAAEATREAEAVEEAGAADTETAEEVQDPVGGADLPEADTQPDAAETDEGEPDTLEEETSSGLDDTEIDVVEDESTREAQWVLEGSGDDLTLRIYGSGIMPAFDEDILGDAAASVTTLIVEDSVTELQGPVSSPLVNLQTVTIGSGITEIPAEMFYSCDNLTTVNLPSTLKKIGYNAFGYCTSLASIDLPAGLTELGGYAFGGCTRLKSITIPAGVTSLGNTEALNWEDEEYSYQGGIFASCINLDEVHLPAGLKAIGNYVFYECGSLTSIDIPDSVEYIGDSAFMDCGDLEECELPASLKEVGSNAFSNCDNIKGFTFPKGFRKLGMCALDYTDPDFVMFPASLETVEGESFALSEGGTIYFGGSEAQFKSLFKTVIEAHDREWSQEGENYLFFDRHRVYYDLPDGPVLAQSLEVDAPDTFNVGEKVDVNVRILPENATCDYVRIYFDSYYINAKQDGDLHATLSAWAPDSGDLRVEIRDGSGLTYTKTITAIDNKQYDSYKYNIAFNGNGATSGKMSQLSKVAYTKNQTLTANAFKRTGYTFTGWNTAKDGSGTSYSNKEVVRGLTETNGGTVTLYAQWEIIPYTITYNLGSDDAVNAETNPSSYDVATAVTLAAPTRPFSTFQGWYSDAKLKNKVTNIKKGSTGNKTFYAKWTTNKYSITFKGNGATSGKMNDLTGIVYNADKTLTTNAFKRTGYHFVEWNTAADGSGDSYANKQVVNGLTTENGVKIALYAIWEKDIYTITYNLGSDDAVNADANPATYDVETAVTLADPTRPFSTFQGWYTDKKLKTKAKAIKKGSTGNKTFYAKWTTNKYSISFKGNGATSGKMKDLTGIVYNADKTLTANAFKRKGYHFVEWNTAADGSGTSYANKQVVNGLSTENNVKIALYAIWEKDIYTISYVLNGADAVNASENPVTYDVETAVTLTAPTREHYTFGGWYSDKKLKKKASTIKKGSTGNKTFYAKWTPNKYNIAYNGNGSTSGKMKNTTGVAYGSSKKLTGNAYSRKGYKFIGWNTAADGSGTSYANKASVLNLAEDNGVTVTLYAQWEIENYKITYNLNGGTAPEAGNPATYTVADETITLAAPTKTGYTFSGWYSDKKLKKKAPTIKAGSTGSKTFYAKWTANKYTIVFDGNGATGGSTKKISGVSYGSSKKLTANGFKKTGATFQGWNTEPDGSGTTYKNKASVKNLTAENGATVTLYAIWSN